MRINRVRFFYLGRRPSNIHFCVNEAGYLVGPPGLEEDPTQQFLSAAQDFGRSAGGVLTAEVGEHARPDVGAEVDTAQPLN